MDRSTEFSRVVEIFSPRAGNGVDQKIDDGGHTKPPPSPFVALALKVNSNLEGNNILIDKMSILADRKEFSNDPTGEMGEISEVFNAKAQQVQKDLVVMKRNSGGASGYGVSGARGAQQQQHFKLILESLNKRQSSLLASFQSSMKKHTSNVELRNKRVGKYGAAASLGSTADSSNAKQAFGGEREESKETYAMFSNSGPSLRPSASLRLQQQRSLQSNIGTAAVPQSGSLLNQAAPAVSPTSANAAPGVVASGAPPLPMRPHQGAPLSSPHVPPTTLSTGSRPGIGTGPADLAPPPTAAASFPLPPPAAAATAAAASPHVPFYSHPADAPGPMHVFESSLPMDTNSQEEYRPGSTYTSRRRPRASGASTGLGAYQDQYYHGYGDGNDIYGGDNYENPKMAQQKRDRSRLKGAEKVEAALAQMGSLFSQVASMVVEQGEVLTRIEDDVEGGLEEVKLGHQEMEKFWEISKQGRGVILTLIAITVVFVVFFLYIR